MSDAKKEWILNHIGPGYWREWFLQEAYVANLKASLGLSTTFTSKKRSWLEE